MFFSRKRRVKTKIKVLEQRVDNIISKMIHMEHYVNQLEEQTTFVRYIKDYFNLLEEQISLLNFQINKYNEWKEKENV